MRIVTSEEMKEDEFPRTRAMLKKAVQEDYCPGLVVGLWRKSEPNRFFVHSSGYRSLFPTKEKVFSDTRFDIASVSKVIATTTLFARLVERGWVDWDDPVVRVLPEFPFPKIRFSHLLSHTAGYVAWLPFWKSLRDAFLPKNVWEVPIEERQKLMKKLVFQVGPEAEPGVRMVYSDLSFIVLGFALESLLQKPLDRAVCEGVFEPMGMTGASYQRVTVPADQSRDPGVAATEDSQWRGGILQGQVHDDNCWAMGGYAGHAGVFCRALDLLIYSKQVLNDGFFSEALKERMWTRVSTPKECSYTLGWDTPTAKSSTGDLFSRKTVGHLGTAGASLWIDRQAELAVALLSNRVHPSRDNLKFKEFRPLLHNALRLDLIR